MVTFLSHRLVPIVTDWLGRDGRVRGEAEDDATDENDYN